MAHHPSTELVARAWILSLPDVPAGTVAATLPAPVDGHYPWEATGFYTVTPAGGTPHVDIRVRRPLVQVDAYATKYGSQRPPHGRAAAMLESIVNSCWDDDGDHAHDLDVKTGYYRVRVYAVSCAREPQRLYGDEQSLAKYSADLQFHWAELAEVAP